LTLTFSDSDYSMTPATAGVHAKQWLPAQDFDLIVLDLGLPDMDGLELLRKLRSRKIPLPILILTARDGINDRITGIEQGLTII